MPSLLETFYIKFTSNADDLKKGEDDAKKSSADLENQLNDTTSAGTAMGEKLVASLTEIGTAFVAAFGAREVFDKIRDQAEYNAQLGLTATRLGVNVEQLAAFSELSSRLNGGDRNAFSGTIDYLNKGLAEIATKGTSRLKPFFDELKIRATDAPKHVRPIFDILGDLSDRLSKLDAQQAAGIAEKLGIDTGTLLLLRSGRVALDDMITRQKELGTVTEHDTEVAHAYANAQADLVERGNTWATQIGTQLLPMLTEFFQWIGKGIDYLAQHKGAVEAFFIGVSVAIGTYYLPAIIDAAIATIGFLGPWLLLIGAIALIGTAFALIYDDVQHFLAGQKSVIGELSKRWPEVGQFVRGAVKFIGEALHEGGEVIRWFFDLFSAQADLARAVAQRIVAVFDWIRDKAKEFAAYIAPLLDAIFPGLSKNIASFGSEAIKVLQDIGGVVGWLVERFKHLADDIRVVTHLLDTGRIEGRPGVNYNRPVAGRPNTFTPGGAEAPAQTPQQQALEVVRLAQAAITVADRTPLGSFSADTLRAGKGGDKSYYLTTGPITIIPPSGDPQVMADHFSAAIQDSLRQTLDHFDDGVKG